MEYKQSSLLRTTAGDIRQSPAFVASDDDAVTAALELMNQITDESQQNLYIQNFIQAIVRTRQAKVQKLEEETFSLIDQMKNLREILTNFTK